METPEKSPPMRGKGKINQMYPGGHPGNSGGKKGRSGRRPKEFIHWAGSILDRPTVRASIEAAAEAGNKDAWEFLAKYCKTKPAETHIVTTQPHTIEVHPPKP